MLSFQPFLKTPLVCLGAALLLVTPLLTAQDANSPEPERADVVVYGGTPGGVMAAIAAAREGASTLLLEQTQLVGGLSTSGLNRDEGNHLDRQTLGGLCEVFLNEAVERSDGMWTEGRVRTWQSGIAEQVLVEMLKEAGVDVRYGQLLEAVEKDGSTLTDLKIRGGQRSA